MIWLSFLFSFSSLLSIAALPLNEHQLQKHVQFVHENYFPELADAKVLLKPIRNDDYFFQTRPLRKNSFAIFFNPRIFNHPPSEDAIRAILIHEFTHILDYSKLSPRKWVRFGSQYLLRPKFRQEYERATDKASLARGKQCEGLIRYREWIYTQLSENALRTKQKMYLTPSEINAFCATLNTY
jgi:hypothetical protein